MGFAQAIRTCFRNYVTFSGRASRPEYWYFALFILLGNIGFGILDGLLFGAADVETAPGAIRAESNGPLAALFGLATLLPGLAAAWRRMHDTGRSGLYVLYPLIVTIGIVTFMGVTAGIFGAGQTGLAQFAGGLSSLLLALAVVVLAISPLLVLWWLSRPSEPGPNRWGPNPGEAA